MFLKRWINFVDNAGQLADNVCNFSRMVKIVLSNVKYRFSASATTFIIRYSMHLTLGRMRIIFTS